MDSPVFLEVEDVLDLHADVIDRFGGTHGVRDAGLLESAVAVVRAGFGGESLHGDLFEMAAAYLHHITRNHPFVDGNKRTGASAAMVFLDLNGWELTATPDDYADLVLRVAAESVPKGEVAAFLREHSRRA